MKPWKKSLGAWLLAVILAGSAFLGGEYLRAVKDTSVFYAGAPAQASALLKLTPEKAPVALDSIPPQRASDEQYRSLLDRVFRLVETHYMERITEADETKMAHGAVRGMLQWLDDPDTRFVEFNERELLEDADAGIFHGVGAVLALGRERMGKLDITRVTIVAPMPGSPAEAAGLKARDVITDVGGKWIITHNPFEEPELLKLGKDYRNKQTDWFTYQNALKQADAKLKNGISISDALDRFATKSSGELNLCIQRPGRGEPIRVKVRCRKTVVDPVSLRMLKHSIAHLRIAQFSKRTEKEFSAELGRAYAQRARAIILDLRNNPGGSVDAAARVASKLTGGGTVATIQEKKRRYSIRMPKTRTPALPIVVLVNGGTASVAELVAGTIKDCKSATVVGTKTYGDGLLQTPLILQDGSSAIISTGKMLTPKGTDFNGQGLLPDSIVEDEGRGDPQLAAAAKLLASKLTVSRG